MASSLGVAFVWEQSGSAGVFCMMEEFNNKLAVYSHNPVLI